jgi:hypothetical protein
MIGLETLYHAHGEWFSRLGGLLLLYPEIHYTFKFFPFSRYKVKEPEILTDAPYRVDPGAQLPVLLLIKDADKFPIQLRSVSIRMQAGPHELRKIFSVGMHITTLWWYRIFYLEIPEPMRGKEIEVQSEITCQINGKEKHVVNDNFAGLSHSPLKVFCSTEPLPSMDGWHYGDLHYHTNYTADQVEFGAPLTAAVEAAKSIGLDFFAATDHSYDLDDFENDYLHNDPDLTKWKHFQEEVAGLNSANKEKFVVLPGEEVSVANEEGCNVHCLVLNDPQFIPGSGDSAERWGQTDAEFSIGNTAGNIPAGSMAVAAHPMDPVPLFEKLFIRRGRWSTQDCRSENISGLQILNGLDNAAFYEGLQQWIDSLRIGRRIFIFAGNDAHGNFNRFRQVKTPMLSLHEIENHQRFGWAKTCALLGELPLTPENLISSLRNGRAVLSNGPLLTFSAQNERDQVFQIGDQAYGRRWQISLTALSSDEMGALEEVRVIQGNLHEPEITLKSFDGFPEPFHFNADFAVDKLSYLRCEATTAKNLFCYTNPVWFRSA